MQLFLLISTLAVVSCRPQHSQDEPTVDTNATKVTLIPFYGGGKGQSLQIVEKPDGSVTTAIIKTPQQQQQQQQQSENSTSETAINPIELENPPLPSKHDADYSEQIKNIHRTALNIIKLQEVAQKNGKLNDHEEARYKENMDSLNLSAQNLALFQEYADDGEFENREGLSSWFERKKLTKSDKNKKKEEEHKRRKVEEEKRGEGDKKVEEKEDKTHTEKPKEEEEGEEEENGDEQDDSIAINLPADDASVAEAKPIGLAIAGEGGVAASKPIATAVVGPGGLAIARPVGTAIAGVAPDQALVPIYAEGFIGANKPRRNGATVRPDNASEYLNKIISKYHRD